MDKEQIKVELVDKSNKILEKYSEMDVVETISVMNMASKTIFLGSLKVYNTEVIPNIIRDLEKDLKGYADYKKKVRYKLIPYIWSKRYIIPREKNMLL